MQDFLKRIKQEVGKLQTLVQKKLGSKTAAPAAAAPISSADMTAAKNQYAAGKPGAAIRILETMLAKNPDQMDALELWISIYQKKIEASGLGKEKAYFSVLKEANKRFNNIAAKSLLVQFCHKYGKRELAIEWYKQALMLAKPSDPRLIATTTLLKESGWLNANNNAHTSTTKTEETYVSPTPSVGPETTQAVNQNLEWWGVDQPLWCYGWAENPTEIEPPQSESRIILFQFTGKFAVNNINNAWAPEDFLGQISRAIPLYLLEQIYYHSDHSSSVVFPVTPDGRFGYLAEKITSQTIISVLGDRYPGAITGHFTDDKLELTHLNLKTQEETKRVISIQPMQVGRSIADIEKFLYETCHIDAETQSDYAALGFSPIPSEARDSYLAALAQHITLVNACYYPQAAQQLQKPHRIIRHFLDLVFSVPTLQTQLILLSAIEQNMMFHSEAIKDYQEPLLAWLSEEAVNPGPLHALASSAWEKFAAYCGEDVSS